MEKKLIVMSLVLVFLGTGAFAVGFIGTPTAELGQGKWGLGFNYSYSSQDLDKKNNKWDDGTVDKLKLRDFNTQLYYGTLSYGITDCWDVDAQLGLADVKADAKETWSGGGYQWGMNFDNDFAWGLGTKVTLAKEGNIDWGAAFQMNFLNTEWSTTGDEVEIDTYDLLIAAGPTIDMGGWKLYGGPYYYYLNGDYDEVYDDGGDIYDITSDLRNSDFGGYIGAAFDLASNCSANIEYSTNLNDSWSIGTGFTFKF